MAAYRCSGWISEEEECVILPLLSFSPLSLSFIAPPPSLPSLSLLFLPPFPLSSLSASTSLPSLSLLHVSLPSISYIHLTSRCNISRDVLHSHRVLNIQSMTLTLDASLVHQHTSIGRQSSKGQRHVIVDRANLTNRSRILEFGQCTLLHGQYYCILTAYSNLELYRERMVGEPRA